MPSMRRGALAAMVAISTLVSAAARAQAPSPEQIRSLEEKLEALQEQADALRTELERLKSGAAAPAPQEPEDLTAIEPVQTGEKPAAAEPAVLDAQVVENRPAPSGKIFNPDISVIGNVLGHAGDENPFDERDSIAMDEAEISLQAFVDPYAKAAFFIGVGEDGAALEEGYLQFLTLPLDLTAKVGKLKASFGKFNTQHAHTWLWADQPLVSRNLFGDEGLADSGVSVSRLFPNRWNLFIEGTGEVYRGSVEDVFERQEPSDLLYVGHLKTYRDLSDSANVELGGELRPGNRGRERLEPVHGDGPDVPLEAARAVDLPLLRRQDRVDPERPRRSGRGGSRLLHLGRLPVRPPVVRRPEARPVRPPGRRLRSPTGEEP